MRIKKLLQEESKKIDAEILEDGQDIYSNLVQQYCVDSANEQPKKHTLFNRKVIISVCCVFVALLIVGIVYIFYPSQKIEYLTQNETMVDATLEEIYKDINNGIKINTVDYSIKLVTQIYDAPSNDTLYYSLNFESKAGFASGQLYFIVNNNYSFMQKHEDLSLYETINGYEINYTLKSEDLGGLYFCEYYGCITLKTYKILFSYEDVVEQEDISPLIVLNSLLSDIK